MKLKAKLTGALKIWVIIYPSITAFLFLFGEKLAGLPLHQRTLILTAALVPWMMFVGGPVLEFVVRNITRLYRTIKAGAK